MKEFEIYHLANLNFINNAIYLLCVIVMTILAFYLIRRSREINAPTYGKAVLTLFCTCIIFFDVWKISHIKELMEKHKFKQIRFIEWIKTIHNL